MDDLEDELDLRYHKGLSPDVYYRCPTLESLDGALRNELEKSASSLIPTEIVTEFIFATASTITIPTAQQPNLDALIEPADFLQSIAVEHALCREIDGKQRLRVQRAIARSIIEAIQDADKFRYVERHAVNKEGGDGARLKYICQDSSQHRKSQLRRKKSHDGDDDENEVKSNGHGSIPMYDCGGAIHIKFSIKREAIHVVYKHNPIHGEAANNDILPALQTERDPISQAVVPSIQGSAKRSKKKTSRKDPVAAANEFRDPDLDMSTSPEAPKSSTRRKRKKSDDVVSPKASRKSSAKKSKKTQEASASAISQHQAIVRDSSLPTKSVKGKACIRCREKRIKCNEAKPTCNQCKRGLWTCQYDIQGVSKRSKNGCLNCKQRRRKCTEEKPSCAHCLRVDDDCEYAEYS